MSKTHFKNISLLMRIFLGELSNVGGERPAKQAKVDAEVPLPLSTPSSEETHGTPSTGERARITPLVFGEVPPPTNSKHYGLKPDDIGKGLAKQLLRFMDHTTRPINLERQGPKMSTATAADQKGSFLR